MVKLFFSLSFQLLRYKGIPNSAGLSIGIWRYKAALVGPCTSRGLLEITGYMPRFKFSIEILT